MKNYTVVYDPVETEKMPAELQPHMDELYLKVQKGKFSIKRKLDKLVRRYPHVASLRNYQTVWYEAVGDLAHAKQVNDELFERFPDYLFAIVNKAVFEILEGNVEEAYKLLGNGELDISTLFPERKTFHITEFVSYTRAAIHYMAATSQFDEAEACIEKLKREGFKAHFISELTKLVYRYRLKVVMQHWQTSMENTFHAIERTVPTTTQETALLGPQNAKYDYLYDVDLWNIDTGFLEKDMREDPAGLVSELHYILRRSITVMEYTFQEDKWTPAVLHAALLLAYTDPQTGFEELLDLFRQPAELAEIYTGDWIPDVLNAYFARPFDGLLNTVKKFVLEPLTPVAHKNVMLEALKAMVGADNGYRFKITGLLEELMISLREQKDNPELMDPQLMAFVVGAAIDIKAIRLVPLIGELYAEGMVSETIEGGFEEVKGSMLKDEISEPSVYTSAVAHIKALNKSRNRIRVSNRQTKHAEEDQDDEAGLPATIRTQDYYGGTSLNAPCPCGSGKKFKRCHGKQ